MEYIGNQQFLSIQKTAFLCSRKIPASVVLKCYDWAIEQRVAGNCVISGFHSQIEKDVFHYLLKGKQPIILVLARGLIKKIEPESRKALDENRLLIISPFEQSITRASEHTAQIRNKLMIDLADQVAAGYIHQGGKLEVLLKSVQKPLTILY